MELTGWNRETSPFHSGEQELQGRLGLRDMNENMARRMLRPNMPEQHQEFFAQLPYIIAGSVDEKGWPWASMLVGEQGFISTPNDTTLSFNGAKINGDPFWTNTQEGQPVGFVGIELATRRRNRVNGVIVSDKDNLKVEVSQSYGNCPQYIHTRDLHQARDPQTTFSPEVKMLTALDDKTKKIITSSDVFFVASHNPKDDFKDTGGIDASHRGGKPGFVKVEGNTLTIPDYSGNNLFNTFGNFLVNPKAGLLFIDFSTGDIVQLTGKVDLLWDKDAEIEAFKGAERAWQFHVDHGHVLKAASPYRWELKEHSPNAQFTGDWNEAAQILSNEESRNSWKNFKVTKVIEESSAIRSFYLEPEDGSPVLPFNPGQFLTLRVTPKGAEDPVTRTYTVSSAPSDPYYRISVKREGLVSTHLHDEIDVGANIEIHAPKGAFWMDTNEQRPTVLLAAGVGITPMMSMIRQAATDGFARRHHRPITLLHASQTTEQRAFAHELTQLQEASNGALRYISLIERPAEEEIAGLQYHVEGRVTPQLLQKLLPIDDYDFYLCGPGPFMQGIYDMLIKLGTSDARIFAEAFGPASLKRIEPAKTDTFPSDEEAATEAVVTFEHSQVEQGWTPDQGTLLEFAEGHGLTPNFGCRGGSCGSCAVKVKSGKVAYQNKLNAEVVSDEALICCAVPAKSDEPLILDL